LAQFLHDLHLACRRLAGSPGFSTAVLLTLALGIGANTAIFSFVEGVLLRPLPYPQPDRLVNVCETNAEQMGDWCAASPANAKDWSRMSRALESIGLARSWPFAVKLRDKTVSARGGMATPGAFAAFAVQPAAGRLLEPQDMEAGSEHVVLISHSFWRAQFAGKAEAVGSSLLLDEHPYQIVGVLPQGFELPVLEGIDVRIPLWPERQDRRDWRGFIPFARLAGTTTLAQAQAEMETIRSQLAREHPDTNAAWGVSVQSLAERITRPVRPALLLFLGAVGLLLLIACANVANLMLARSLTREREQAVRLALGANRAQLIRAMLGESLLLSLAGGCAGAVFALWAVDLFVKLAPAWFPRLQDVRVSLPVLGFTVLLSLLSSLVSGLIPALHASDLNVHEALKSGRPSSDLRRGVRVRSLLVVMETALALMLLVGAGLLTRSFAKLVDWRPGFDRQNLLIVPLFSSRGKYPVASQLVDLFESSAAEMRLLPNVVSAGAGSAAPLSGGDGEEEFVIQGRPAPAAGHRPSVAWFDADPDYFQTLGIPLLRGRYFTRQDRLGTPPVAIINETMARHHWPNENPIGQRLTLLMHQETVEVVGVVHDVQPFRPDERPGDQIYWPFAQSPRWAIQLIVRTSGDPSQAAHAVRAGLARVDPDLQVGRLRTMDELVGSQLTNPRFNMTLSTLFAVIGLAMAALGVYGVMAFSVAQRRREIGIRLAVGASASEILRMVIGKGLILAASGVALGLAGALSLTHLLKSLLVNLAPSDPATLLATSGLLLLVAVAACYVPARRALGVDPTVVLRSD
jgi:putative ABC transport system permease protein